jgi:hypothetical protein
VIASLEEQRGMRRFRLRRLGKCSSAALKAGKLKQGLTFAQF